MFTDMPLEQMRTYAGSAAEPPDFDAFWTETISEARASGQAAEISAPALTPEATGLATLDVYDLVFPGYGGEPVRGWLRVPHGLTAPVPAVVQFVGYGGGRGAATEELLWASAGYAHIHMDTRGQGSVGSIGATPDTGPVAPSAPGVITRGIGDPHDYYYRRLITDAVRAIDAATSLACVDTHRVAVTGHSQGGLLALAAAALHPSVRAIFARAPFLCDIPHALEVSDAAPMAEITDYLAVHRREAEAAMSTLGYVDGVNFASRGRVPGLFSAALRDETSPASTVFAAFNAYAGLKRAIVWPHTAHEAGGAEDDAAALAFFAEALA
jgi:cephalosporin-C deacetylase